MTLSRTTGTDCGTNRTNFFKDKLLVHFSSVSKIISTSKLATLWAEQTKRNFVAGISDWPQMGHIICQDFSVSVHFSSRLGANLVQFGAFVWQPRHFEALALRYYKIKALRTLNLEKKTQLWTLMKKILSYVACGKTDVFDFFFSTYLNTKMCVCVCVCLRFSRPFWIRLGNRLARSCLMLPKVF